MKQTTDELKKIIENAPELCNYVGDNGSFFFIQGNHIKVWLGDCWSYPVCNSHDILTDLNIRSLSDIREIIELRERLEEAKDYLDSFIDSEFGEQLPCYDCGCEDSCSVNFNEAREALDILKGRN